ncbi:MAG: DUF2442 domain-containing protein [Candidatus Sumerlaeia bacterium]|nr:DUF2442 domain-containing protein [Candidatus Sumerlaeia bacterium]
MDTSRTESSIHIRNVNFDAGKLNVVLSDDRVLSFPMEWYPRLLHATDAERGNWRLLGGGEGVHWEEIDEDLSLDGFLNGRPAVGSPEYRRKKKSVEFIALDHDLASSFESEEQVNKVLREYLRSKRESA